jgi:hypothetical protein
MIQDVPCVTIAGRLESAGASYTSLSVGVPDDGDREARYDHPVLDVATASATGVAFAAAAASPTALPPTAASVVGAEPPSSRAFRSARSARNRASSAFISAGVRGGFYAGSACTTANVRENEV